MTPETKVKQRYNKRLVRIFNEAQVSLRVSTRDNIYGKGGMPDNDYCASGVLYWFVEFKAEGKDVVSGSRQGLTIEEMQTNGEIVFVIRGSNEVDAWFEHEFTKLLGKLDDARHGRLVDAHDQILRRFKARENSGATRTRRPRPPKR